MKYMVGEDIGTEENLGNVLQASQYHFTLL